MIEKCVYARVKRRIVVRLRLEPALLSIGRETWIPQSVIVAVVSYVKRGSSRSPFMFAVRIKIPLVHSK